MNQSWTIGLCDCCDDVTQCKKDIINIHRSFFVLISKVYLQVVMLIGVLAVSFVH